MAIGDMSAMNVTMWHCVKKNWNTTSMGILEGDHLSAISAAKPFAILPSWQATGRRTVDTGDPLLVIFARWNLISRTDLTDICRLTVKHALISAVYVQVISKGLWTCANTSYCIIVVSQFAFSYSLCGGHDLSSHKWECEFHQE